MNVSLNLLLYKMTEHTKLKSYYGVELAKLLADKICKTYPIFQKQLFIDIVDKKITNLELKGRVEVIADTLHELLPRDYREAVNIMMRILGPPNQNETGMFRGLLDHANSISCRKVWY